MQLCFIFYIKTQEKKKPFMRSQLSRIDDDKLVSHCWHLFCPQNFKVDSTNESSKKKVREFHCNINFYDFCSQFLFFFYLSILVGGGYVFFFYFNLFVVINFIITLVCSIAQKHSWTKKTAMRPEWAWIDALHGLTTLLTNRTTTITIPTTTKIVKIQWMKETTSQSTTRVQRNERRYFKKKTNHITF